MKLTATFSRPINVSANIGKESQMNAGFSGGVLLGGGGMKEYNIGSGLKLDEATNTLSVDVANDAEKDNTNPITSAAVYTEIGNIDALLKTI
jgi:hypothetical protein